MQLVAYGAQDIYLTGNPSITFFKIVYRRHTNFALESIEQVFSGAAFLNRTVSCTVSRNGDLVTDLWVEVTVKKSSSEDAYYVGEALIKEIELEIGGQRIDRYTGDWMRIYDELFRSSDEKAAYRELVDFEADEPADSIKRLYIPCLFFFTRSPGLALPLIALQYHEVKVNVTFNKAEDIPGVTDVDINQWFTATMYASYAFLDTDERRRFAQVSHEYLVTQIQHTGEETVKISEVDHVNNVRLNLNHPVKYLAFAFKAAGNEKHGVFTGGSAGEKSERYAPLYSAKLQLNGHDRFSERKGSYFSKLQPFETLKTKPMAGVYLYSFALRPSEHQPSGTCNFSRIDNATLILRTKKCSENAIGNVKSEDVTMANTSQCTRLLVFAENYNVLRIMSGMGGLASRIMEHCSLLCA